MAPRGDFGQREAKKPKKDNKKATVGGPSVVQSPEVQLVKKKVKKGREGQY